MAATTAIPTHDAQAQERRRILRARDVDTTANISEQYARLAEEKRLESIRRLKELLTRGIQGDQKAEMMLRLADLYFQQGRYLYLKEMAAFDKVFDACFDDDNCATETLQADNSGSQQWQTSSIKLYRNILKNHPTYSRTDQATFFLGSALQDTGKIDDAANAFKRLVKLYPTSNYVPDAYVLIGEYYFEKDNAFGALKAYLRATEFKDSDKYPFALYKLGWCYYNVGEYAKGIDTMKMVVDISNAQSGEAKAIQLQEEALKDLVRFFADADAMDEAIEYFTKLGKKDLIKAMLMQLASTYFEQGKFDKSVDTYKRLILEDPNAKACPEYQTEIIKAYRKVGQRERILEEVENLLRTYGPNSTWARNNASDPAAVKEAGKTISTEIYRTAAGFHNEAKKLEKGRHSDANDTYELARQAYALFLREYPSSDKAYEVHYSYGELLYKIKDFGGAYEQYMAVVALDANGKHSKFCAESAIFAAEEQVKQEGGGNASGKKTADAKKNIEPQELTTWEQRLVTACKQYADLYPNDSKVRNAIYKSAYLLYNKYRFAEAGEQFKAIISREPTSNQAQLSADLMLDSFVVREDWNNLKSNSKFYYDLEGLGTKKWKKETFQIYENASFKVIEVALDSDGDKSKAADGFVAFYEEFPESKTAAQALNNASVYYRETDRLDDSTRIRHILVEDPKFGANTKYYYSQVENLGGDYELIADFERASHYFELLWNLYPEERKKRDKEASDTVGKLDATAADAIYTSGVFRTALGDWETGVSNYNQFIAAFSSDDRVPELRLRVAKIYEDQGEWLQAGNVYKAFYEKPPAGASADYIYFARLHYGQMMEKLDRTTERSRVYNETVKLFAKQKADLPEQGNHVEFVAEMMFKLAQPELAKYLELRITGAPKGANKKAEDKAIEKTLKAKTQSLIKVTETFTKVVTTGAGEWGLASLVALGKCYEDMGISLNTSHRPFYLTEDQIELYDMKLEDTAYVQQEKAVNAYKLALDKSYDLTLYNENTEFATRRLGELRPDDYPGLEEELLESRYTSQNIRQFDPETSL
jgi:TolA-binding protein